MPAAGSSRPSSPVHDERGASDGSRCVPPAARAAGQALVEMAIALPVLALMVFGLTEVGFIIKTRLVLQDAIRAAARYGSEAGTISGTVTTR